MKRDRLPRKLAAILYADIVGYSRMASEDEDGTHYSLKAALELVSTSVTDYGGQVVNYSGDAVLAVFDAAVDALSSAAAIQRDFGLQYGDEQGVNAVQFRIGVNLGDIIEDGGDVFGDGVNIAARLESLADPGGICISESVYAVAGNKLPFEYQDMGAQAVKNIAEPIHVYRVKLKPDSVIPLPQKPAKQGEQSKSRRWLSYTIPMAAVLVLIAGSFLWFKPLPEQDAIQDTQTTPASSEKPSIAVLPFTNMSGDPEQGYFSDGMTEDLITDLSKLSGLFVVARNSSFAYKGLSMDLRQVADELGVSYLLEGSVRRQGDQVRINAQLIDGATGGHIWAERFDGTMSDIFELQDGVNQKIVEELAVSLTLQEQEQFNKVETSNPEAYDLLLRGLEQFHLSTRESTLEARKLYKQAIELDPEYARAYANLALTYASDVNFLRSADKEESIRLGLKYAARAIELDNSIPQIYFTRSALYLAQGNHAAAIEAGRRMVEVHPTYADGYGMLAFALCWGGDQPGALEAIRKMHQIDPQVAYLHLALEGRILFFMQRYEEAAALVEESISRNPAYDRTQLLIAAIYAQMGRLEDASWAVEEALLVKPFISLEYERKESNYKRPEDLELYINALRKAGVPET